MTGRVYIDESERPGRPVLVLSSHHHHRLVRAEALRVAVEVEDLTAATGRDWVVYVGLPYSDATDEDAGLVHVDVWIETAHRGTPGAGLDCLTDAAGRRGIEVAS